MPGPGPAGMAAVPGLGSPVGRFQTWRPFRHSALVIDGITSYVVIDRRPVLGRLAVIGGGGRLGGGGLVGSVGRVSECLNVLVERGRVKSQRQRQLAYEHDGQILVARLVCRAVLKAGHYHRDRVLTLAWCALVTHRLGCPFRLSRWIVAG